MDDPRNYRGVPDLSRPEVNVFVLPNVQRFTFSDISSTSSGWSKMFTPLIPVLSTQRRGPVSRPRPLIEVTFST